MGFGACLDQPPSTPSALRTSKNVLCLIADEHLKSPIQSVGSHSIVLNVNGGNLHQADSSDNYQTPKGSSRTVLKQSSWGHIDLFLDSLNNSEDASGADDVVKTPIARKTIRVVTKKKSTRKAKTEASQPTKKSSEDPRVVEKDDASTHIRHQSPVRRLVRTLSLTSTRSIMSSPRRRTPLRRQPSDNKMEGDEKIHLKERSQRGLGRVGSFRLCTTEAGAVDTSTPEAALRHMSLSPQRKRHVKKQNSDSHLISPKPWQGLSSALISPTKSRSLKEHLGESIAKAPIPTAQEKELTSQEKDLTSRDETSYSERKTWDDLLTEFTTITDE